MKRRTLLQGGSVAFALTAPGLVGPAFAQPALSTADWNKAGFEAKTAADAIRHLGSGTVVASRDILIEIQDVIENGARTRIEVTSRIPNTQSIAIIAEKNPFPLAASFDILPGGDSYVSTRLKMGLTSDVRAIVKADGKFYTASKEVKVTVGGCG